MIYNIGRAVGWNRSQIEICVSTTVHMSQPLKCASMPVMCLYEDGFFIFVNVVNRWAGKD